MEEEDVVTELSARAVALECLMAVTEEGQFSHTVLNSAREKYAWMPQEDRAFFGRLVHGSLEYMLQSDRITDRYSSVKTGKMKPVIRNIFRLSVYQLMHLDRVPVHAVTNEAVKLTEKRGLRGLKGFVNAVLRKIGTEREKLRTELRESEDLSLKYSCPEWLVSRFVADFGKGEAEAMLNAFLLPGTFSVRLNRCALLKSGRFFPPDGACERWHTSAFYPEIYTAEGAEEAEAFRYIGDGLIFAQDLSSALAVAAAEPKPEETVIDLCAAPGGKSLAAADLMEGRGHILSFDISDRKVALLRENVRRNGFEGMISAECGDAAVYREELCDSADLVIADLPCSGLGVLGRKPDIKLHVSPESIRELAALQRSMLRNALRYVKPGGRLLFSTCTVTREENLDNRAWLLREYPEYVPVDLRDALRQLKGKAGTETLCDGYIQLLPQHFGCDGFFFSVFQRKR